MSVNLTLTHNTPEHGAVVNLTAESLDDAIASIQSFIRGTSSAISGATVIEGGGKPDSAKKSDSKSTKAADSTPDAKPETKSDTKADPAKDSTAAPTPTASDSSASSSTASPKTDEPAEKVETAMLTYDGDIKPLVLEVSKKNKDHAVAMLQRFGSLNDQGKPSAQALKEDQWPAFVAYGKKVLAGEIDPTASHDDSDEAMA